MIVYGDPGYEQDVTVLLTRLRQRAAAAVSDNALHTPLDTLRGVLIFSGQVEQALWDDLPAQVDADTAAVYLSLTHDVTRELAAAFLAAWADAEHSPTSDSWTRITQIVNGVCAMLEHRAILLSPGAGDMRVRVKLPEGYAFYALYPEQYAQAARDWTARVAPDANAPIVVIGIRSIGTSLAALVSQTIEDSGRRVICLTTRPTGHPFARHIESGLTHLEGAQYALVVDEGPGMSGSSMAAVAHALSEAGIAAERIAFLPGHASDPGGQGDDDVKRRWATTPRFVTPTHEMRWNGLSLPDALAHRTCFFRNSPHRREDTHVEDFGGGLWRKAVYTSEADWPAVCAAFEMPKYRVTLGDGTRVLWKFAGLATNELGWDHRQAMFRRLGRRKKEGWTAAPLGGAMGFVAIRWVDGTPLTCADVTPDILRHIGLYIAAVADFPLTRAEHSASLTRLADMLYWNVWEALGEEHAARTRAWSERAQNTDGWQSAPTYGDGRMAPHEWLRLPDGKLLKTDSAGHDTDHTVVGKQSWLWDIAGAIMEWHLGEADTEIMTQAAEGNLKYEAQSVSPQPLTFYRMAYAAFRAGQTHLCAQMSGYDPAEEARLWQAYTRYKEQLRRLLASIS